MRAGAAGSKAFGLDHFLRLATWFCVVDFSNRPSDSMSPRRGEFACFFPPALGIKYTCNRPQRKVGAGRTLANVCEYRNRDKPLIMSGMGSFASVPKDAGDVLGCLPPRRVTSAENKRDIHTLDWGSIDGSGSESGQRLPARPQTASDPPVLCQRHSFSGAHSNGSAATLHLCSTSAAHRSNSVTSVHHNLI